MKKIFKIANYDFKRIALNPIAIVLFGIVLIACFIIGCAYKIPTTPAYTVSVSGNTTRQLYSNFLSANSKIDTKDSTDSILTEAKKYLQVQNDCDDYQTVTDIKENFDKILIEIQKYATYKSCTYTTKNSIEPIISASNDLKDFVGYYSGLVEFESDVLFTNAQFKNLMETSTYFDKQTNSNYTVTQVLDNLAENIKSEKNYFEILDKTISGVSVLLQVGADKLQEMQEQYITTAEDKCDTILTEMKSLYDSVTSYDVERMDKMESLITNYKSTCENAKKALEFELQLLFEKHFGDLGNFYGYQSINSQEVQMQLALAQFYLNDTSTYYVQYQQALNFNTASYQVSMYDHAYFIISIVGFITILVGIFCAYKLFGQDRKNGKMDLLLSQNVTFNQVFVAKFIAIVLITSFYLALFSILSLIWGALIYGSLPNAMLAVFNLTNVYTIHPFMFFLIKVIGIELQVIFYSIITIFLMNVSRKFELCFGISAGLFVVATICNIFLNGAFVYCLFPFIHADLTSFLGGATMSTGFLKTSLYTYGNFLISVLYYLVVVALLFNFTKQLFKKN